MKKLSAVLACALTVGLLGGCGNSFDAAAYTKALLDNSYKNDSKQFVEMKIGTAEEAEEIYNQGLDAEMAEIGAYSGDISDEKMEEFRSVFASVLAGADYTVGDAEKQSDGSFIVTITYQQMNIYGPAMTSYIQVISDKAVEVQEAYANGEEVPSDAEMSEFVVMALKDSIAETMNSVTYDDPETTTIRIELNDNVYSPNESDVAKLTSLLFDIDEAMALLNSIQ